MQISVFKYHFVEVSFLLYICTHTHTCVYVKFQCKIQFSQWI